MKYEISLETLVMAKRALEDLSQWHLERAVKDLAEFDRTADLRKRAYKAASQIEQATYTLLLTTKLEVTNGTGND
jgi:hypothetical protein